MYYDKFSHGANFAVFMEDPTTVKIKTAGSFNSPVGTALSRDFVLKIRTVKKFFRAFSGIFAKVCAQQKFPAIWKLCNQRPMGGAQI